MTPGSECYGCLGIPERLAGVLWKTVQEIRETLIGREDAAWVQLTGAALSRCVLHFACLHHELGGSDVRPEVTCSEVFHRYAEQIQYDRTAVDWKVPPHMLPVVCATVAACGQLVIERMVLE